jgi:hypothetical protein
MAHKPALRRETHRRRTTNKAHANAHSCHARTHKRARAQRRRDARAPARAAARRRCAHTAAHAPVEEDVEVRRRILRDQPCAVRRHSHHGRREPHRRTPARTATAAATTRARLAATHARTHTDRDRIMPHPLALTHRSHARSLRAAASPSPSRGSTCARSLNPTQGSPARICSTARDSTGRGRRLGAAACASGAARALQRRRSTKWEWGWLSGSAVDKWERGG